MARRYYSSTAVATTLSALASNSATSITVTALTGYPNQTPFTAIIDPDTASEEVVEVTGVAGTTLTVTRGVDGTSAVQHSAGAVFRHGVSGRDFDEANEFVNSTGVAKGEVNAINGVAGLDGSAKIAIAQLPNIATNAQAGSYTLVLTDAGKLVEMGSGSAQTLTVPPNASVAFPVGTKIDVIQTGAGETTIAAWSGVTINSEGSKLKINAQWQAATLVHRSTDSWVLIGALKS